MENKSKTLTLWNCIELIKFDRPYRRNWFELMNFIHWTVYPVSRDFQPFLRKKNSIWAPHKQAKTVSCNRFSMSKWGVESLEQNNKNNKNKKQKFRDTVPLILDLKCILWKKNDYIRFCYLSLSWSWNYRFYLRSCNERSILLNKWSIHY